jgi:Protein of unknown function (DUF3738)
LADRFQLKVSRQTKKLPVFELMGQKAPVDTIVIDHIEPPTLN